MPFKNREDARIAERKWREANADKVRAKNKRYAETLTLEDRQRKRGSNPERERVHWIMSRAIKRGWIVRPSGMNFHHPDYSRPYFGCWVTQRDHGRIHAGLIPCPECIDYEPIVKQKEEEFRNATREAHRRGAIKTNLGRWGDKRK